MHYFFVNTTKNDVFIKEWTINSSQSPDQEKSLMKDPIGREDNKKVTIYAEMNFAFEMNLMKEWIEKWSSEKRRMLA